MDATEKQAGPGFKRARLPIARSALMALSPATGAAIGKTSSRVSLNERAARIVSFTNRENDLSERTRLDPGEDAPWP